MTEFFGRLLARPETLQSFDEETSEHAPDEYVRKFVRMGEGDLVFIEVSTDKAGPWSLWRVQCIEVASGFLAMFTARCTETEARAELAKLGVPL